MKTSATMKTFSFSFTAKVFLLYVLGFLLWAAPALSQHAWEPLFSCEETVPPRQGNHSEKAFVNLEYNGQLGPDHGRFGSVAFDPLNKGVIYAVNMDGRQLFLSTDNGASWDHLYSAPKNSPQTDPTIRHIGFSNPNEPTHLYFLIVDRLQAGADNRGLHIMDISSQEMVEHMYIPGEDERLNIMQYAVHPAYPGHILAITRRPIYTGEDVWISNNGGKDFRKIYDHEDYLNVRPGAITFNPDDPNIILVGRHYNLNIPVSGGIYISTNGGETWTTTPLLNTPIGDIVFPEGQSQEAYAISGWGSDYPSFYRSGDGGMTWTEIAIDHEFDESSLNYLKKLLVDPQDHNNIYITHAHEIIVTRDAGDTWEISQFEYDDGEYFYGFDLAIDPFDNSHMLVCSDLRVIRTQDAGHSWEPIANKNTVLVNMQAVSFPNNDRYLFYDADASFFSHNLETGEINGLLNIGYIKSFVVFADPYTQDRSFVAEPCHNARCVSIHMSDDNFSTEPKLIYHDEHSHLLQNIIRDPHEEQTYWLFLPFDSYNGYGRLLRTTNGFQSFQQLTVTGMIDGITSIQAVEGQPGVLWAYAYSGFDAGVFKSTDYGNTWKKYSNGLSEEIGIWDIAVNPNNPDNLLATVSMNQGIYRSMDGGETWEPAFTDFECVNVVFSEKHKNLAFAQRFGQMDNIVYTTDGGLTWFEVPNHVLLDADYSGLQLIDNEETIDFYMVAWGMGVSHYTFTVPYFSARFHIQTTEGVKLHDAVVAIDQTAYEPGHYNVDRLMPDDYTFVVAREGYEEYSGTFSIADRDKDIYVELTSSGTVDVPFAENDSISLFPNPARSTFTILSGEKIRHVEIISVKGSVVYADYACKAEKCTVDVSEFENGMYVVIIQTETNKHAKSIMIAN